MTSCDIFIDANVLLNVYETKGDDINDLQGLMDLAETGVFNLVTTDVVKDEFLRNRDRVIAESMKEYNDGIIGLRYPSIVRHMSGYGELKQLEGELKKKKQELRDQIMQLIEEDRLPIDKLINKYFDKATMVSRTSDVVKKANTRDRLGQDPGKPGQLGDHINWLLITGKVGAKDLCIVSADGDYECRINRGILRRSLKDEWAQISDDEIYLSTSIRNAVGKFEVIAEKHERPRRVPAIEALEQSGSFAQTHSTIATLDEFRAFSEHDVKRILDAYRENGQVGGISCDDDVAEFLRKIDRYIKTDKVLRAEYAEMCKDYLPDESDDEEDEW